MTNSRYTGVVAPKLYAWPGWVGVVSLPDSGGSPWVGGPFCGSFGHELRAHNGTIFPYLCGCLVKEQYKENKKT